MSKNYKVEKRASHWPSKEIVGGHMKEWQSGRRQDMTGKQARLVALALGHLDPLDHILQHRVHSFEGIFSLRRLGSIVVAFHINALMVYGCQISSAAPGGKRVR